MGLPGDVSRPYSVLPATGSVCKERDDQRIERAHSGQQNWMRGPSSQNNFRAFWLLSEFG